MWEWFWLLKLFTLDHIITFKRCLISEEVKVLLRKFFCSLWQAVGSVAEWSKALVLGTSHYDGVGSNPTAAKESKYLILNVATFREFVF